MLATRVQSVRPPLGKQFDNHQVSTLRTILKTHKAGGGNPISLQDLFRKLHDTWRETNEKNPFYLKTPKCFKAGSIFFVQLTKAMHLELKAKNFDDTLMFIYRNVVVMNPSIDCMPDVSMSEAGRILKKDRN